MKAINKGKLTTAGRADMDNLISEFEAYRADAPKKCEFWPESRLYWSVLPVESLLEQVADCEDWEADWDGTTEAQLSAALRAEGYKVRKVQEVTMTGVTRPYVLDSLVFSAPRTKK